MSQHQDPQIAALLRQAEPPARDPWFRLQVLERRERREFRAQLLTMGFGGIILILVPLVAAGGGNVDSGAAGVLAAAGALACSCVAFRRNLRFLRHFRL